MSGHLDGQGQCDMICDDLPELALGILFGRRRADVLHHVGECPRCSVDLEQFANVADVLMEVAPPAEAPVGFELRLAERLQGGAHRRPRRLRLVAAACSAAAVVGVLGFAVGALSTHGGGHGRAQLPAAQLITADPSVHERVLGEVMVSAGRPAWMFMTIDASGWSGTVSCEVTLAGGEVVTVGVFQISGGYGAWATPLTWSAHQLHSARIVAANGVVLASARLGA